MDEYKVWLTEDNLGCQNIVQFVWIISSLLHTYTGDQKTVSKPTGTTVHQLLPIM